MHCLLMVHVDNGMAGCNSRTFLDHVKESILVEFSLKDLGPVRKFLGVEFECSPSTFELWLHQDEYIDALLTDYNLADCHSALMPMDAVHPFRCNMNNFPDVLNLKSSFQALMGRLLFLSLHTSRYHSRSQLPCPAQCQPTSKTLCKRKEGPTLPERHQRPSDALWQE